MSMRRIQLREDVKLAGPKAAGVLLGEAVREAGLDPAIYAAVIPGECGTAGRVNANGRIYKIEESVPEHERLCERAGLEPNFGERDHPQAGPSWNVITRFLGGRTEILEDGSAKFYGNFGVLNSSLGQDMLVNWRAGVPIGVSLRARGIVEEHLINESSPYAKMNPDAAGRKVSLVSEVEFIGYDWVRVPSAGTYLPPPDSNVTEALARLNEAVEADPEEDAVFKTWSDFEKAHPEAAKVLRAEVVAEATKSLTESVSAKDAELAKVRDELRESKAANAGQAEMLKELVEAQRKQTAELAAAKLKGDVTEALDKFIVGRRAGAMIKANVLEELAEGRIADAAQAIKRAEKYAGVAEAAGPSGNATGATGGGGDKKPTVESSDGGAEKTPAAPAGAASKLKALNEARA